MTKKIRTLVDRLAAKEDISALRAPREAFRFDAPVELADPVLADPPADPAAPPVDPAPTDSPAELTEGTRYPVSILARSGKAINHWWFGPMVHDMEGMTSKPSIALDFAHDDDDVIGYADKFEKTPEGLKITGNLVSLEPGDCADKIYKRSKAGVPYEASIQFDDMNDFAMEFVAEGVTAQANGQTFTGPLVIFRQWRLMRTAICLNGADSNTSVALSADNPGVSIAGALSQAPVEKPADTKPEPRAALTAELKRYTDRFGPEGATHFTAGLSYQQAADKHIESLTEKLTAAEAKVTDLTAKLAAVPRGTEPLSSNTPDQVQPGQRGSEGKFSNLSEGRAKFAAGIKIPKGEA